MLTYGSVLGKQSPMFRPKCLIECVVILFDSFCKCIPPSGSSQINISICTTQSRGPLPMLIVTTD
jgi:hypothetical protein